LAAAAAALAPLAACDEAPDPAAVARGADVFAGQCSGCHQLHENTVGPMLADVVGRPAGEVDGFSYSDAMRALAVRWEPEELHAYLMDPIGYLPGGLMAIAPLSPEEARDVVAYLASEG
jgi:cytochrome c